MRLMYTILLIAVTLNCAIWLIQVTELTPFTMPAEFSPTDLSNIFSLSYFQRNFLYLGVGAASGLAMLLLRQNTFALYALVIFAVMILLPIVSDFILVIPHMIDGIMALYPQYNPMADVTGGVLPVGTNPYSILLFGVGSFAAFWFILDKVTGGFRA